MYYYADILGKKFGRLTVLEKTNQRKNRCVVWKCQCDCGKIFYAAGSFLKYGTIKSCGCLQRDAIRKAAKNNILPGNQTYFNSLFSNYKRRAHRKNLNFNLTTEEFTNLCKQPCYYCLSEPSQTFNYVPTNCEKSAKENNFVYNGVDRIDNSIGYTLENCVPCCKVCNYAKNSLTQTEFLSWIEKVYNNFFR